MTVTMLLLCMQDVECVNAAWAKPGAHNRLYGLCGKFCGGLAICAAPLRIPYQGNMSVACPRR